MDRMGPWGFGDAVVLLSPIGFLVAMVLKPNPMPTSKSLWLAAILLFIIKLWYLQASPLEACACFIKGVLQALTPCSIVAGAIFLFDCMESSQCLKWMKVQLRAITDSHPVAEVMLIGFCFAFVVEGASGFGTPAALAAPMLHSMGHPKLECVVCLLTFNTFMTIFGAVGTPVWFGIGEVVPDYGDENLMRVGLLAFLSWQDSFSFDTSPIFPLSKTSHKHVEHLKLEINTTITGSHGFVEHQASMLQLLCQCVR